MHIMGYPAMYISVPICRIVHGVTTHQRRTICRVIFAVPTCGYLHHPKNQACNCSGLVYKRRPDGNTSCWRSYILLCCVFYTRCNIVCSRGHTLENIPRSAKTKAKYFCRKAVGVAKYSGTRCAQIAQGRKKRWLRYQFHVGLQSPHGGILGVRINIWLHVVRYLCVFCLGRISLVCECVRKPIYILYEKQNHTAGYVERDFEEIR